MSPCLRPIPARLTGCNLFRHSTRLAMSLALASLPQHAPRKGQQRRSMLGTWLTRSRSPKVSSARER
jgi:hypothetical protein